MKILHLFVCFNHACFYIASEICSACFIYCSGKHPHICSSIGMITWIEGRNTCVSTGNSSSSEAKPRWKDGRGFNSAQGPLLIPLNRLLNFWFWSDEFEKQARTRKVTSTVRDYLYPVHRTPTDDPIYGGGNGPRWG